MKYVEVLQEMVHKERTDKENSIHEHACDEQINREQNHQPGHGQSDASKHAREQSTETCSTKKERTKKELMEELEKVKQENRELSDRLLRTLAEFDNYRKRVTREKEELAAYGTERLALALLPVLDNFERACEQAHTAQEVQQVVSGVEMILKQLRDTLEKFNIKPFDATGEMFDPEKHEAVAQQEHDTYPANTVTAEVQKGYYLGDKLLRPARVIVAREPQAASD